MLKPTIRPTITDLGRLTTIIKKFERFQDEILDDIARFNAPSECVPLALKGERGRLERELGMPLENVITELLNRTSDSWVHKNIGVDW